MSTTDDRPATATATKKPLKKIPSAYGIPFFSPIKDRIDFFYSQGQYKYFESRVATHNSTVLRMNMIPGPFSANPRVVALCDAASFPVLFDPSKVEKKNCLTGSFMPSLGFTGGYRVCAYLDPSEDTHTKIKQVFFNAQARRKSTFIPIFVACFNDLFDKMETELSTPGNKKSKFTKLNEIAAFDFVCQTLVGPKPSDSVRDSALKFVFLQFHPITTIGLPSIVEELLFHTFTYPAFVAKSNYKILLDYFGTEGAWILDNAEKVGVSREEAVHHLIFTWVINAYLGIRTYLTRLFKWVVSAGAGTDLHARLAHEVRTVVESENGELTFAGLERMELTKSVAYEVFRIDPPVQVQYGTARADMVIESHEARYEVKKGEMLCGFQPMATRDPKVFDRPTEFVADRFVGEEGRRQLKHVLWANGPETESTRVDNKMCAGKDLGTLVGRLLVAVMFRRYDGVEGEVGTTMEELDVTVTELTKAK